MKDLPQKKPDPNQDAKINCFAPTVYSIDLKGHSPRGDLTNIAVTYTPRVEECDYGMDPDPRPNCAACQIGQAAKRVESFYAKKRGGFISVSTSQYEAGQLNFDPLAGDIFTG